MWMHLHAGRNRAGGQEGRQKETDGPSRRVVHSRQGGREAHQSIQGASNGAVGHRTHQQWATNVHWQRCFTQALHTPQAECSHMQALAVGS